MESNIEKIQKDICEKFNAEYFPSSAELKLGIALNVKDGTFPINGLRHKPDNDTTGWYIWAGEELSEDPNFFKPLHVKHIKNWCPEVQKFLGLPPGWRFLLANEYEDVWFDESLLDV